MSFTQDTLSKTRMAQEVCKILIFNAGQWMDPSSCLIILNFVFNILVFQGQWMNASPRNYLPAGQWQYASPGLQVIWHDLGFPLFHTRWGFSQF